MSDLDRLVLRLREDPNLSRNRNFDEMSRPEVLRARRALRRLAGIERDLGAASRVDTVRMQHGWLLRLEFDAVRARREAFLSEEEHSILAERHPALRRRG